MKLFNFVCVKQTVKHTSLILFFFFALAFSAKAQSSADSSYVNIPNVFTPNADGVNDIFIINNDDLTEISCTIYNRYGTKIYEMIQVNDYWDGYTTTGEPCRSGVYYYVLRANGSDGKEYNSSGFIQLLK
jgi:gliding motility-associated-like protein